MNLRVGQGYDSHQLVDNIPLFIGGAEIPSPIGSKGHSDGDCLLHAIIDSLLGAFALGDIGTWFPDNDPNLKGIRSTELLKRVLESDQLPKYKINNIDLTLFLNKPKLSPHRETIVTSIAKLFQLESNRINLKAKTLEGMQVSNLIAASSTCLIEIL
jgi:2-C-methyl-D-erythritol 2,4-cyclodiphosphate synthase